MNGYYHTPHGFERQKTPLNFDHQVYDGVRVGMKAMRMKAMNEAALGVKLHTSTAWLAIKRGDHRIFKLPVVLEDGQIPFVTVVLNGEPCGAGDYKITGNTFNWVSPRKLRATDGLAVRYPLQSVPHVRVTPKTYSPDDFILRIAPRVEPKPFPVSQWNPLEVDEDICIPMRAQIKEAVVEAMAEVCEEPDVEYVDVNYTEEDDVMPIEEGVKVWHRMTKEGPWIAVQRSVLKIRSSLAGGGTENTYNDSFVETAWTVQTDDQGMVDYPAVMLTTKNPAPAKKKMALWKKFLLLSGASGIAFAIVNAQWIATLLGYGVAQ